jgi:phosphate transport system substrate-binding protein
MHPPTRRRSLLLAAGLIAVAAVATFALACKNDSGGSSLSGDIRIDGSSTVYPITEAVAEEYSLAEPGVHVNVATSGTGGGFELFCNGEIPISDASRPIKDEETQACADKGITDIVDLQVGIDALTVMVNPANDFVDCLTVAELFTLFSDTSVTKWSQVRAEWPDEDISFYYPGTDSGTFDYFVEAIITADDENATHRGDGTPSEDDNVLATGIENDTHAIGYFGFAYFLGAGSALKAVAIDDGNGCIEPSAETALDGTYAPLSRPLFIYTRESSLQDRPEVLDFVQFYLDNAETLVPDVGYVPMPANLAAEQQAKIAPFLP